MIRIIGLIVITFASYLVGRFSHIVGGHLNTPHHWIYGVIAIIVGAILRRNIWGQILIAFGLGLVVSDFIDMTKHRFFGPDEPGIKKFWGFD